MMVERIFHDDLLVRFFLWRRNLLRTSKYQLQCELELARARGRAGDHPCGGADVGTRGLRREFTQRNGTTQGGTCINSNGWLSKVGAIEDIEGLRPELQIQSLVDADRLEQRSVQFGQVRPKKLVAPRIPKRSGNQEQEGAGIEPPVGIPRDGGTAESRIPVGHVRIGGVARPGAVRANRRREG